MQKKKDRQHLLPGEGAALPLVRCRSLGAAAVGPFPNPCSALDAELDGSNANGSLDAQSSASSAEHYGVNSDRDKPPLFPGEGRGPVNNNADKVEILDPALQRGTAATQKPYRTRHDGWTPDRQAKFIDTLSRTGCVRDACRAVGISSTAAYRVRRRLPAFADSWELALRRARVSLEEVAWKRAVEGVDEDIYHLGKVVGRRKKYAHDLLRLLILRGDNGNASRGADGRFAVSPEEEKKQGSAARDELDRKLDAMRERLLARGDQRINLKTGEGITPEVVEAVQRFSDSGSAE